MPKANKKTYKKNSIPLFHTSRGASAMRSPVIQLQLIPAGRKTAVNLNVECFAFKNKYTKDGVEKEMLSVVLNEVDSPAAVSRAADKKAEQIKKLKAELKKLGA